MKLFLRMRIHLSFEEKTEQNRTDDDDDDDICNKEVNKKKNFSLNE